MNLMHFWKLIFTPVDAPIKASIGPLVKPSVRQVFIAYVIPLSLITPIMLAYATKHYPKLFLDKLPGDNLFIVGLAIYAMQIISIPTLAIILKNLAAMVNIKTTFHNSFLIVAYAAIPLFGISLFYLIPSFTLNVIMHAIAALMASLIIYKGIKNVFGLERRGARFMLTMATLATAAIGFGIVLTATLIFWREIQ